MSKEPAGIKKNVTNFHTLITFVEDLGVVWNPINETLKIAHLKTHRATAETVRDEFDIIDALDKQKTADRKNAYAPLNSLTTRVLHAATACKMEASSVSRIKALKGLVTGTNKNQAAVKREKKAKKILKLLPEGTPAAELPDARSVLQQAYDARYDNFGKLITTLETTGQYQTNEADLRIDALKAHLLILKNANEATINADKAWKDKIAERNKLITDEAGSIYALVMDIKTQLKSMKSVSKEKYKEVCKIRFVKTR